MSGIGGIFYLNGEQARRGDAERMVSALRLYGPVKQAQRCYDSFALCWTQGGLFTPEDSHDAQPMMAEGRWPMVFSGFLYYREELAAKLDIDTARLARMADGALVLAAWQKWGEALTTHLYGSYAMIVCDLHERRLFAIRSDGEATPIFYHQSKDRLTLACAPKAIFALGDVPREIDETRIADSLILNNEDREASFYKDIRQVPLGHILIADAKDVRIKNHTNWDDIPEIRYANDDDYVQAANELFDRAVHSAMRSVRTPAVMLSSGFDSSAVVVQALKHLEGQAGADRMISFTSVPANGWDGRANGHRRSGDESGPVKDFAAMYPQLDVRLVNSQDLPIDHDLDKMLLLSETPPFGVNNFHWIINIHQLAAAEGRNVLMGGGSGNRTLSFDGRSLYAKMLRQGKWGRLLRELRMADNRDVRFLGLYKRAIMPNLPAGLVNKIAWLRRDMMHRGWTSFSAINPDYAGDMRVDERAAEKGWDTSYSGFSEPREMMRHMGQNGSRNMGQPVQQALMALTGVANRDPLGERKLVEYCMGLPGEQFLKDGVNRRLIKRMMAGKLPDAYFTAPRGRQSADWHLRMTRDLPRYRQEVERMADDAHMARRLDVPRLRALFDNWPDKTPRSAKDHPEAGLAIMGLGRAIATSRFINWVQGKN